MKALRRSIKGDKKDLAHHHISITPKSAVAIVPPKKVIKALYDYNAQTSQELSFQKGDFFHVIARENDTEWYEACNPALPDARGLVPVTFFQALGKTERDSGGKPGGPPGSRGQGLDHDSGYSDGSTLGGSVGSPQEYQGGFQGHRAAPSSASQGGASVAGAFRMSKLGGKGSGAMVYGIVLYDFAAERPDELEANAGEAIIVIAQSNPEWFVAKPIGRLGGPGLIPVSFIEIRDMVTGQAVPDATAAVQRAGVPKVEEWKKMAADYKNSSIELGKLGDGEGGSGAEGQMARMSLQQAQRQSQMGQQGQSYQSMRQSQQPQQQPQRAMSQQQYSQQVVSHHQASLSQTQGASNHLTPVAAHIPRYLYADEKYWFIILCTFSSGHMYQLSRYYEDFYDFQIQLLTEFPDEAGNTVKQKRTLPYMPGPVNYVTDLITEGRRDNLDGYVKSLLSMPEKISRGDLVKGFFAPREGDFEVDPNDPDNQDPELGGEGRYSGSQQSEDMDLGHRISDNNQYGGLSAAPPRQQQSRQGYPEQMAGARQPSSGGPPPLQAQASSMSTATQSTISGANTTLKVKISFGDDLFAIRVPREIAFQQLYDKIRERLKIPSGEEIVMAWKDDSRGGEKIPLAGDEDLDDALAQSEKMMVFVEYGDYTP